MRVGLGIFCSTSDNKLSTNHKLRLENLSERRLFEVFSRNVDDFLKLLELSRKLGFTIFRLGSNFVPFASHKAFKEEWFQRVEKVLSLISDRVKIYGVRITMHPGQYVVLNSPRSDVIERSLKELKYHFRVLDALGLDSQSIVVVHVGGVYGDKSGSIKRLISVLEENKWLLRRLALENDEKYYTVSEVLEIAESFGLPVVYDYYHHKLNPSKFSLDRLIDTWRNMPLEIHVSSSPEKHAKFGEHGDFLRVEDFVDAISQFIEIDYPSRADVIPEVKKKELAIRKLVRELKERYPDIAEYLIVNWDRFT